MKRRGVAAAAAAAGLMAMLMFMPVYRTRTAIYSAQVFGRGDEIIVALGVDYQGWRGSKAAEVRQLLAGVLGVGWFSPVASRRELRLWTFRGQRCNELRLEGESAYSLFPVGEEILMAGPGDVPLRRWTGSGFEKIGHAEQARIEEAFEYLSEAEEQSSWHKQDVLASSDGNRQIEIGRYLVRGEHVERPGRLYGSTATRISVTSEGRTICDVEMITDWQRASREAYDQVVLGRRAPPTHGAVP